MQTTTNTKTVKITATNGDIFGRYIHTRQNSQENDKFTAMTTAIREIEQISSSNLKEAVLCKGPGHHFSCRDVYFSNICGKLLHYPLPFILREETRPMHQVVKGGFGEFTYLASPFCNFTVCNSGKCTLFRGAKSTHDVTRVAAHALHTQNVRVAFLHMLVASSRIGHPIYQKNSILRHAFSSDSRWHAQVRHETEDRQFQVCFELKFICFKWTKSIAPHVPYPLKALMININRKGSVNYFLSLDPATEFDLAQEGAEEHYRPIYTFFHEFIAQYS